LPYHFCGPAIIISIQITEEKRPLIQPFIFSSPTSEKFAGSLKKVVIVKHLANFLEEFKGKKSFGKRLSMTRITNSMDFEINLWCAPRSS
jgi:hypothetical protein